MPQSDCWLWLFPGKDALAVLRVSALTCQVSPQRSGPFSSGNPGGGGLRALNAEYVRFNSLLILFQKADSFIHFKWVFIEHSPYARHELGI